MLGNDDLPSKDDRQVLSFCRVAKGASRQLEINRDFPPAAQTASTTAKQFLARTSVSLLARGFAR